MTTPHPHPHPDTPSGQAVQPSPELAREYLARALAAQVQECADTWAALQQTHREKLALAEEVAQLRAELAQARNVPRPSRADLDELQPAPAADG